MIDMKGIALAMGIGAAAGAVTVMMLPRQCAARRMVDKAAEKVEDAAYKVTDKINKKLDQM